jgi:hypothetical protein
MRESNKEKWILPTMAISLVENIIIRGGETEDSIMTDRKFDKTREAWVSAVFLLAKTDEEKRFWYLRGNEIQNSVNDIFARCTFGKKMGLHILEKFCQYK